MSDMDKTKTQLVKDTTNLKRVGKQIEALARFPSENTNPVLRLSSNGAILYANEASQILLKKWASRVGGMAPLDWQDFVLKALRSRETENIEFALEGRTYSFTIVPVPDAGYANLYGSDITEQRRLQRRVEYLARFPSENPNPVLRVMADGTVRYANDCSARVLKAWKISVGKKAPRSWRESVTEALSKGVPVVREIRLGKHIYSFCIAPVPDAGYANLYGSDITERIRAEAELKQHKSDLEKLVEKRSSALSKSERGLAEAQLIAHLGNWDWNIVDNELRWSDEIYRIFGLAPQKFGATYEAFLSSVHPDDREYVNEAVNQALCEDKPYGIDHRIVLPGGAERVVHEEAKVFRGKTGKAIRMVGTVQDITERKETESQRETINLLLRTFITTASRKQYLDDLVGLLHDVSGCRCVCIRMIGEEGNIPCESSVGFNKEFLNSHCCIRIRENDCVCARIAAGHVEPVDASCMTPGGSFLCENTVGFVDELSDQQKLKFRGVFAERGFVSVAIVPINYRNVVLGIIHLADEEKGAVSHKLIEFLESMSPLIGEAIHRFNIEDELRSLSSQLSLVEEQERKRLATALHDSVGQTLALSKLKLGELGRLLSGSKAQAELTEIRNVFEKGIQQLRSLTFELSPPILYELGLGAALEWLGEQFEQRHAVEFHFEPDGEIKNMDEVVSVLMFQSAREVLANVGKHARAQHVKATASMNDGRVCLVITDDGLGFDADAVRAHSYERHSFGLFSIRERMRHIGGTMGIESKPGKGTTVTLSAPAEFRSSSRKEN